MFIIANAGLFAFLITRAGVPEAIGHWLEGGAADRPAMFLLGVNAALFVIGMFIETSAAIIVLAPILAPVAMHFGIDPVHFGLVMVVNLALGHDHAAFRRQPVRGLHGGAHLAGPHRHATWCHSCW